MNENKPMKVRRNLLHRFARKRNWHRIENRNSLRARLYSLSWNRHPWWDWGHRMMVFVGMDFGGNWSEPSPSTWYYRAGPAKRMWRTNYPIHPLSTYQIVKTYDEFRELTRGLDEESDAHYEWKAICVDQDGDLRLGRQYWGGNFYGLNHWEFKLLRRYLIKWNRLNWYGLRSWLYSQALHAAVNQRKPFSCQETPPRNAGAYSHWHCQLKKRHDGPHRFNAAEWSQ